MSSKPIEITDEEFDKLINSHELVVVDFWAQWCPPCKMLAPIIEELAREYSGRILFAKLDTDRNPVTPTRYEITAIPTLLIFSKGKLMDRIVGFHTKSSLKAKLQRYLD